MAKRMSVFRPEPTWWPALVSGAGEAAGGGSWCAVPVSQSSSSFFQAMTRGPGVPPGR